MPLHHIDREHRRRDQQWHIGHRGAKDLGGALETAQNVGGYSQLLNRLLHRLGGLAQRHARRQVEGEGHGGKLALVIDRQESIGGLELGDGGQRNQNPIGGVDVNLVERRGVEQVLGLDLQNDVELVVLPVQDRDLPLAERVVESVVNGDGRDAQAGGGVAVNDHCGLQALG